MRFPPGRHKVITVVLTPDALKCATFPTNAPGKAHSPQARAVRHLRKWKTGAREERERRKTTGAKRRRIPVADGNVVGRPLGKELERRGLRGPKRSGFSLTRRTFPQGAF